MEFSLTSNDAKSSNFQDTNDGFSQSNSENVNTITCKIINCEMLSYEIKIYEEVNSSSEDQHKKSSDINKLYEHPFLVHPIKEVSSDIIFLFSGKMVALKKLLKNLKNENKKKIIILSNIAFVLDTIKNYFEGKKKYICLLLNGSIRGNKRQETIDAFNSTNNNFCILLIEINSSKGINLSSADALIFYDNDINKEKEAKIIQEYNFNNSISLYHLIINNKQQINIENNEYKINLPFIHSPQHNQDVYSENLTKLNQIHPIINIPYIELSNGMPNFPFKVNDDLEILSIGTVVNEKGFHTEKYIFPLGYCARRFEANEKKWYILKVIKGNQSNPIFRIELENDKSIFFEDSNLFKVCSIFNNQIKKNEQIILSGTQFFGFSIPIVHFIIQNLDGVNKISNYHMINYVMQEEAKADKRRLKFQMGGACIPKENYMINIDNRIKIIKENYVDMGEYFVINRSRQTGKTTTLFALAKILKSDYIIFFIDLEDIYEDFFKDEKSLVGEFLTNFLSSYSMFNDNPDMELIDPLQKYLNSNENLSFSCFLKIINSICEISPKKIILIIDEIDRFIKNSSLLIEFLSLIRGQYQKREMIKTFHSVILSGVRDIQHLRSLIRHEKEFNETNSPWNINKAFTIDMSFSEYEISTMLEQYESLNYSGMDIPCITKYIYEYTSGHPFLVSLICKFIDEEISNYGSINKWSKLGVNKSVNLILNTKITFFSDILEKLKKNNILKIMLKKIIFKKEDFTSQNIFNDSIDIGQMFGLIKVEEGNIAIANRMIEMVLTYYFISEETVHNFHKGDLDDRSKYFKSGKLDMEFILKRFIIHFNEIFGKKNAKFLEEHGRLLFMTYLKPIINGTGHFYIESQTQDGQRTDLIVDYLENQYLIELKLYYGQSNIDKGKDQLIEYLNKFNLNTGYLLIFNFNATKTPGITKFQMKNKIIIQAMV